MKDCISYSSQLDKNLIHINWNLVECSEAEAIRFDVSQNFLLGDDVDLVETLARAIAVRHFL